MSFRDHQKLNSSKSEKKNRRQRKRLRGFTVVEVLTVSAMCSIWLSVAMPWISTSRQSQQEVRCKNNLKQIGLAMHNYHDVYSMLPPGWNTRVPKEKGYATLGWGTSVLPFVDQFALFRKLDTVDLFQSPPDMLKTAIPAYRCPLDSMEATNSFRGDWGTSNYVGNFGSTPIGRPDPLSSEGEGNLPSISASKGSKYANGIFAINSKVRFRDITDGMSNTILAGERSVAGKSALWPGPRSNFNESDVVADGSFSSKLNRSATGYGSRHESKRILVVLCDGAVRALTEQVDSKEDGTGLLQKLSGRDDGLRIDDF